MYLSRKAERRIESLQLRWEKHVAGMKEDLNAFKILTGKFSGNGPMGRPRGGNEVNIGINLEEIESSMRNWNYSTQNRDYCRSPASSRRNLILCTIQII